MVRPKASSSATNPTRAACMIPSGSLSPLLRRDSTRPVQMPRPVAPNRIAATTTANSRLDRLVSMTTRRHDDARPHEPNHRATSLRPLGDHDTDVLIDGGGTRRAAPSRPADDELGAASSEMRLGRSRRWEGRRQKASPWTMPYGFAVLAPREDLCGVVEAPIEF